ncbi:NAD(P)/FAD-dependent oxidoreductase [Uliginosibacterium sp. H3]|uniref:NAD(P)/FAD-dependent oxidoreductase n=1 Tax=Uliginosibacterium silvisoli TaxID=3114758 RepID=A0ABU6K2D2_9RHOO|nr:NAD(P)/FAD-dependent oxidoreductase [Uliginosibacterium sp. H3]
MKQRVAVVGAGPMGLTVAYELLKAGKEVTIFERDDRIGGMSAAFDFAGTRIERYYHFVCGPDEALFAYLREFKQEHLLKWVSTKMGFYFDGKLYDWGHPLALLKFPGLSLWQKIRYGLQVMGVKNVTDWRPLDAISSTAWLQKGIGKAAYDVLWKPLFHFKFYEFQDSLSAAWLGTRIKRVALSRKSLFEERMGYLEGGSERLLDVVAERIRQMGGQIVLSAAVEKVETAGTEAALSLSGLTVGGAFQAFDQVVSTIPLPYLVRLMPGLPEEERAKVAAIRNVGVVCVLLKLRKPFSRNFWMNINDERIEIPGLIEYTNLNPLDGKASIVYAPYYMPQTHPKYARDPQAFIDETIAYMKLIEPDFSADDVIASSAHRYEFAQTVCTPGFFDQLPPMQSTVKGLFMADTSHYYPEDRSICESMALGAKLAAMAQAAG